MCIQIDTFIWKVCLEPKKEANLYLALPLPLLDFFCKYHVFLGRQPNVSPCVSCRPNARPPFSRLPRCIVPFCHPLLCMRALYSRPDPDCILYSVIQAPLCIYIVHCPLLAPTPRCHLQWRHMRGTSQYVRCSEPDAAIRKYIWIHKSAGVSTDLYFNVYRQYPGTRLGVQSRGTHAPWVTMPFFPARPTILVDPLPRWSSCEPKCPQPDFHCVKTSFQTRVDKKGLW